MTKKVMKLALEALKTNNKEWKSLADSGDAGYWKAEDQDHYQLTEKAIKALEEALKQEQDDPMAYVYGNDDNDPILSWSRWDKSDREGWHETPIYTKPQSKEWVGLTKEDIDEIIINSKNSEPYFKAIEAKLKERNT
jgi:hypothetical protein